jgi:hypothetical protein
LKRRKGRKRRRRKRDKKSGFLGTTTRASASLSPLSRQALKETQTERMTKRKEEGGPDVFVLRPMLIAQPGFALESKT